MSISVEAAEARDSLSDDKELVNTYEVTSLAYDYLELMLNLFFLIRNDILFIGS